MATIMSLCFLYPCDYVQAAEKELNVELDKDYVSCDFSLCFENEGDYQAVLIDPNGNTHQYIELDDKKMVCTMEKTPQGAYVTHITNSSESDIGKVTLTVSTTNTQTTDIVDNNIKVGRDISGLKMYFKDNTFIASWTDETCGAVNVKVINLDTLETIKNEKVNDREFECEIPEDIKQIAVNIVPSSSSSIKGAELNYNFDVYNNPDAVVTFPDIEKTNQDKITVKVSMGDTYGIYVEDNEECVLTNDLMVKGSYDIEVPLQNDGKNDLMFYIVDKEGNMRSTFKSIYKDTVAPTLSLTEEYDGIKVDTQQYTISGTVSNYNTLTVNGEEITPATDGYFESVLNLHWGENKIHISAADDAGNETVYDINLIAEEPKTAINIKDVFVIAGIIIILIVGRFFKGRKKSVNTEKTQEDIFEKQDEDEIQDKNENESKYKFSLINKLKKRKENSFHAYAGASFEDESDDDEETEDESDDGEEEETKYGDEEYENQEKLSNSLEHINIMEEKGASVWDEKEHSTSQEKEETYTVETDGSDKMLSANYQDDNIFDAKTYEDILGAEKSNEFSQEAANKLGEKKKTITKESLSNIKTEHMKSSFMKSIFIKKGNPADVVKVNGSKNWGDEYYKEVFDKEETPISNWLEQVKSKEDICCASDEKETEEENNNKGTTSNICQPQTIINVITHETSKKKKKHSFWGDVVHLGVIFGIFFVIFRVVLITGFIKSASMEPTLMTGDFIVGNRLAYTNIEPQRGDIIFFKKNDEIVGKRVIGIAGDIITFADGKVLINNKVLDESEYLPEDIQTISDKEFKVPEKCVFVLGDNRENSFDSRYWEDISYVEYENIVAKMLFKVSMPMD